MRNPIDNRIAKLRDGIMSAVNLMASHIGGAPPPLREFQRMVESALMVAYTAGAVDKLTEVCEADDGVVSSLIRTGGGDN